MRSKTENEHFRTEKIGRKRATKTEIVLEVEKGEKSSVHPDLDSKCTLFPTGFTSENLLVHRN